MSTNNKGDYDYKSLSHLREEFNEFAGILRDTGKSAKERERKGENGERKTEKTRSSRLPSANYIMLAIKNKSCVHINFSISSDTSKRADSSLNESAAVVCEFVPPHSNIGGGI